jgi:hypothetical protein
MSKPREKVFARSSCNNEKAEVDYQLGEEDD